MDYKKLEDKVYNFKTKYKEGFTDSEIQKLLLEYPSVDKQKFNKALCGITMIYIDNEAVIYPCDIYLALKCGLEKRNPKWYEWD